MQNSEQRSQLLVGVRFCLVVCGQSPGPRFCRQLVHAFSVRIRELQRQQRTSGGNRMAAKLNNSPPNLGIDSVGGFRFHDRNPHDVNTSF